MQIKSHLLARLLALGFSSVLLFIGGCVEPARTESSPNGAFLVRWRFSSARVFAAKDPNTVLWSIQDVRQEKCLVSDDGETVAILAETHNGEVPEAKKTVLRICNRQRGQVKVFTLGDLCDDFHTVGNARLGRIVDAVQWFHSDRIEGDTLILRTVDNSEIRLSLQNGEILSREAVLSFGEKCLIAILVIAVLLIGFGLAVLGAYFIARKRRTAAAAYVNRL